MSSSLSMVRLFSDLFGRSPKVVDYDQFIPREESGLIKQIIIMGAEELPVAG